MSRYKENEGGTASPMLSENRARSHFGASTQMIVEDGTASNVMAEITTPGIRQETASSGAAYDY